MSPLYAEIWEIIILWDGILVRDILKRAGLKPETNTVIFKADDEYTTSLLLSYLIDSLIMMAFNMNNITLPRERGFIITRGEITRNYN